MNINGEIDKTIDENGRLTKGANRWAKQATADLEELKRIESAEWIAEEIEEKPLRGLF